MCMVALGVIQQYYIYLKTAIFFNKKVVTLLYLWLAAALAAWYNESINDRFIIRFNNSFVPILKGDL